MLRIIRETFADPQDLVAAVSSGRFAVLRWAADRAEPDYGRLAAAVRQRAGLQARVGVGGSATTVPGLHAAYEDAASALRLGARARPGSVSTSRVWRTSSANRNPGLGRQV
ncbi:hypothetical protein [Nonomuraea longicatena]|uniref:hypothetical protein n=1 Tax=Nonomuraea longicatena TaxID=83682 RepID=UPI003CD0AEDB